MSADGSDLEAGSSISISNRQSIPVDEPALVELALRTLSGEGIGGAELSLSFVGDAEMEELHVRYMHEPGPTDVLSFPMDEGGERAAAKVKGKDKEGNREGVRILGDVVIAPSVAQRNNPADPSGELRLLLVHGILHLLGFDHEQDDERAEMWARQERYSGVRSP